MHTTNAVSASGDRILRWLSCAGKSGCRRELILFTAVLFAAMLSIGSNAVAQREATWGARADGFGGSSALVAGLADWRGNVAGTVDGNSEWQLCLVGALPNTPFVVDREWEAAIGRRSQRGSVFLSASNAVADGRIVFTDVTLGDRELAVGGAITVIREQRSWLALGGVAKVVQRYLKQERTHETLREDDGGLTGSIGLLANIGAGENDVRAGFAIENIHRLDLGDRGEIDRRIDVSAAYVEHRGDSQAIAINGRFTTSTGRRGSELAAGLELVLAHVSARVGYVHFETVQRLTCGAGIFVRSGDVSAELSWAYLPATYISDYYSRVALVVGKQ